MAGALMNVLRLARAGVVLAQYGVRFVPPGMKVPAPLLIARALTVPIRAVTWPFRARQPKSARITEALASLGPSYIKLGQFLATRADVIGPELASDLSQLQDKLPPFPMRESRRAVEEALGGRLEDHFSTFGPPVAAASIAQVHKATVADAAGPRDVAVKILRPSVERRFKADLDSYYFAARQIERFHPPSRRLRPVAVVDTLKRTTELEMDLRLEAAAISEMAENITDDKGFRVPSVDWKRTSKRVMTLEWIDGIPIADHARLKAAGHDLKSLGLITLRSFLRHAMRDGFFHADMHQGNLLVDKSGDVVAVDFGIMGRLGAMERRFLAEILHGLITRDYRRVAAIHFEAGYVPQHHSVEVFAQAMRAIGEPIHGRTAEEISMADLLGQLFAYTEVFDMETRPELILLQKSMVIVEGVARSLDPGLNMWTAAEPVARDWMQSNLGVIGQIKDVGEGASTLGKVLADAPQFMLRAQGTLKSLDQMTRDGLRLDETTIRRLAREEARASWSGRAALWIGALSLAAIAALHLWG
ncbi:2-polyprenylphenol 6-hydroxylase [Candidatus Filomicrobium marinum]|uniref:2-polyprenylphenol 6-hydroxylase n=1 Tax=Candidatus Filomicrobium marinum TaxID=1608628 RepID=A0A0D6JDY7_9HYPH|nr:2-polyprenylphenol 6-hydroxylase [Candidatus Filomicrobium marinum]CFX12776.1 2-polyprenylphenol 6-hydroxylase [Candidatus Filomicrobium marinum]CPR17494.1 2-polyprenylphenol 6-hydroxylase [Candidatus Filomicrobium marinum]